MADFDPVKELGLKVLHVGINAKGKDDAMRIAKDFETLMGFMPRTTPISVFASDLVEIMYENGRGENGHIGIGTTDVEKAVEYFKGRGMGTIKETEQRDENGKLTFVYFDREIGGFAVHLKKY